MDFGEAVALLKGGHQVCRKGWNGKGMFLIQIDECDWSVTYHLLGYELAPFIAMKTADNKLVPWLASQTDILAVDWEKCNDL